MAQTVLVSMKRRLSWQARLHLPYYGAVACAIRERHMQCLMQVFDSDGKPQLRGGSNLKDHIDRLPLVGLTPDTGQSQNYGHRLWRKPVRHRPRTLRSSSVLAIQQWRLYMARLAVRAT